MRRAAVVVLGIAAFAAALACGKSTSTPPPLGTTVGEAGETGAAGEAGVGDASTAAVDSGADAIDSAPPPPAERTLFIGNSFTFVNDLPGTYLGLATPVAPGKVPPVVASVAYAGYTLTQHLADAQGTGTNPALATLLGTSDAGAGDGGAAHWNHVFLQEQSEIPGFDLSNTERIASMQSTVALSGDVAATGATSVLLMTWGFPSGDPANQVMFPDYLTMQSLLETGYRQMAHAVAQAGHAVAIAPAGLAFQAIHQREVTLGHDPLAAGSLFMQLYGPDLKHPAVPGTYLAACVVTDTIYGVDPTTFTGDVAGVDAATKLVLQTAARDVVNAERARPPP